jgi:GDP-L-fucose synthase
MVGSAIVRALAARGAAPLVRSRAELDLTDQPAVRAFMHEERPDYVILAAAKVGGIHANDTYPADFIYDNLMIEANVIHQAFAAGTRRLLFLGSSCIYPRLAPQPMAEEALLTGPLEPTNEPYAVAKIAGIKLCDAYRSQYGCNFISVMPTNLYGPNDNYDLHNSHVLPALLRKFHEAVQQQLHEVTVWGTGTPKREFLHSDDMADACVYLMQQYNEPGFVNIGTGQDISIADLAAMIGDITGYQGTIRFDTTRPDGTPRKLLDVTRLHQLGWQHTISLEQGIREVYQSRFLQDTAAS